MCPYLLSLAKGPLYFIVSLSPLENKKALACDVFGTAELQALMLNGDAMLKKARNKLLKPLDTREIHIHHPGKNIWPSISWRISWKSRVTSQVSWKGLLRLESKVDKTMAIKVAAIDPG